MLPAWEQCKPTDFYQLFINKDSLKKNEKATQSLCTASDCTEETSWCASETTLQVQSLERWTVEEMISFLATVHMGIVMKPQTVDYWSTNPVLQTVIA